MEHPVPQTGQQKKLPFTPWKQASFLKTPGKLLGDQEVEAPPSVLNLSVGKMEGRVRDPWNCSLFPRPLHQPLNPYSSFPAP